MKAPYFIFKEKGTTAIYGHLDVHIKKLTLFHLALKIDNSHYIAMVASMCKETAKNAVTKALKVHKIDVCYVVNKEPFYCPEKQDFSLQKSTKQEGHFVLAYLPKKVVSIFAKGRYKDGRMIELDDKPLSDYDEREIEHRMYDYMLTFHFECLLQKGLDIQCNLFPFSQKGGANLRA